ncbi:hypothetical protein P879_07165 [Paragonimus westermani]|uniref:Uncharacterized protein n=1 Tax=Paragonimus westermani TaxID=34504 RepID=A0A8T0DJ02_9TREM|nr:hypothetical protein P879_07165 [Paragonimus westermani]
MRRQRRIIDDLRSIVLVNKPPTSMDLALTNHRTTSQPTPKDHNAIGNRSSYADKVSSMVERPPHSKAGKLNKPPTDKPTFQRFSGSFRGSERIVICTNVPESGAPSLQARYEEEKQRWNEILEEVGLNLPAVNLTRLSSPPISPHTGEPRLLRVTLESMSAVKEVLLAVHQLRLKQSPIRVSADIPWTERMRKREEKSTHQKLRDVRAVFIHGVPECTVMDTVEAKTHECSQWRFLQEVIELRTTLTANITRLSKRSNYPGPRILKESSTFGLPITRPNGQQSADSVYVPITSSIPVPHETTAVPIPIPTAATNYLDKQVTVSPPKNGGTPTAELVT